MKIYNKLVRDNIPEIMIKNKAKPVTRILSDEEYLIELNKKLLEEVKEYLESGEIEELADIEEVIIGMDKEFINIGDNEEIFYADKIKKVFHQKLAPFFKVSVLWDKDNLLEYKSSPTDNGKDVFKELLKNRIYI